MSLHPTVFAAHRGRRALLAVLVPLAVLAVAATGFAAAGTFALATAAHAPVRDVSGRVTHESIVVTHSRRAVYTLTGDTRRHPECTAANGCFGVWPPATLHSGSATKPAS